MNFDENEVQRLMREATRYMNASPQREALAHVVAQRIPGLRHDDLLTLYGTIGEMKRCLDRIQANDTAFVALLERLVTHDAG